MAGNTVNVPDGWVLTNGLWNIDAQLSTAVALSGTTSLQLVNTSVATAVAGQFIPLDPVGVGRYTCTVVLRADSITAGNNVFVTFNGYQADRVTPAGSGSSSSALVFSTLSAANTWLSYSGTYITDAASLAVWGQIVISKAATAFNVYIDHIKVVRAPAAAQITHSTATVSIAASTWTVVAFNNVPGSSYPGGQLNGIAYDNSTGTLTVYDQGYYVSASRVQFASLSDGTTVKMRIVLAGTNTPVDYGVIHTTGAAGNETLEMSCLLNNATNSGNPSAAYQVQIWHNDVAGARNIIGSSTGVQTITTESGWQVAKIG